MSKLTPLNCKRIEKKLVKLGFVLDYTDASSACFYVKVLEGNEVVVQVHRHPGDKGLEVISAILRNGKIDREDWIAA